jgi:hypothetical protein
MSINSKQLRELIIRPTLKDMGMWSQSAENLLMGTAAQESHLGAYIKQVGKGPALGIYQCEPATHADIVKYIERNDSKIFKDIGRLPVGVPYSNIDHNQLIYDLRYATFICRLHYYRKPEALPGEKDIDGLASYWKRHYNTIHGAGTVEEFKDNYMRLVGI